MRRSAGEPAPAARPSPARRGAGPARSGPSRPSDPPSSEQRVVRRRRTVLAAGPGGAVDLAEPCAARAVPLPAGHADRVDTLNAVGLGDGKAGHLRITAPLPLTADPHIEVERGQQAERLGTGV